MARWAIVVVVRDDGAAAIVVASEPRAVVRNSTLLRQWRGHAKPVAWLWIGLDRALVARLVLDAEELLPRGVICEGPWRIVPHAPAAHRALLEALGDVLLQSGAPAYSDEARRAEADRRSELEMQRALGR